MPTRAERLKKRSTRVADKAVKKLNKVGRVPTPGSRSAKVLNKALKKGANINKKIVKTKARVATRVKKKVAKVVKKTGRVTKRAVKKDARALNRRVKKATPSAAARAAYKAKKAAKMKNDRTISWGQGPSLQEKAAMKKGQLTAADYKKLGRMTRPAKK